MRRGHAPLYAAKFKPCAKNSNILYTKYTAIAREVTKYSNILLPRLNFAVVRACMRVACPLLPWGVYALLVLIIEFRLKQLKIVLGSGRPLAPNKYTCTMVVNSDQSDCCIEVDKYFINLQAFLQVFTRF